MIALHPIPFQVPQSHILSHVCEPFMRRLCPSLHIPRLTRILLKNPSVEKMHVAIEYTNTQLIKFGTVVKV